MIILPATTDSLELVTSAAGTVHVDATYVDHTTSGGAPGNQRTIITTAATTTVLSAPAASTQRQLRLLIVRNAHATDPNTVTLLRDISATDSEIFKFTLAAGESALIDANGMILVYGATGIVRASGTGGALSDGDYGDITVSGTGTVWTIDAGVVTLAKMANVAERGLFLRTSAGAGVPEVQVLAANIVSMLGAADYAAVRALLSLASMALQADSAVAITGGTITGTTIDGVSIKVYVDNLVAGLKWKQTVVAATTVAGTLATDFENGDTLDGVVLATNDRILIKDQEAGAENGIYIVAASGAPTRATDADSGTELVSATVSVEQGTANADKCFVCTNNAITLGVTSIAFVNFQSALTGALLATNNLSDLANAATARGNLGVAIGSQVQAWSAVLDALAAAFTVASASGPASLKLAEDTDNGSHTVEVKAPASVTANRVVTLPDADDTIVGKATTDILTNKQINPRTTTTATAGATLTIDADATDLAIITAQDAALTIAAPTPVTNVVDGQKLMIRITDNGTARALTWNAKFRAVGVSALPTTTVLGKTMYVLCVWNTESTDFWDVLSVLIQP